MKPHQWRRSAAGKYLRHLPRIKNIRGTWLHRVLGDRLFLPELWHPDRLRIASGCAIGAFCAMLPLPIQMVLSAFLAFLMRANIPAAVGLTWVSNPLTTPFFVYAESKLGMFLLGNESVIVRGAKFMEILKNTPTILKSAPLPVMLGGILLAIVFALST